MADKKLISANDLFSIVNEGAQSQTNKAITPENFASIFQNTPEESKLSWMDVPVQAVTNAPQSAINFGKGIYEAVTHPLETGKNVLDIAAGGLKNVTPKVIADLIDRLDQHPEAINQAVEKANQVGQFYKERYGSGEGFKQALAQDPVGVASDISALLSGGGSLASKLGVPSKIVSGIQTAADITNPITATTKLATAVGKPALGMLTGTGPENIANAAKSGFAGDKSFGQHLRGEAPINEPLLNAKENLNVMRQNKSNAYRSGFVDISKDKSVLDFKDIDKALLDAKKEVRYGTKVKDDIANAHIDAIEQEIKDWKSSSPSIYHTPEGLDALKQRIGAINQRVPYEEQNANRVGGNLYNSIKGTISTQAPKYAEVMKDYAEASDQIHEIERALSLGNRASADTAIRKLQSLTRNNVNTNYGNRLSLAQQLEKEGGKPFINALSGQALSSTTARGLAGTLEGATGIASFANPAYLAAIPFQTPRLVGEALYAGGKVARKGADVASKVNKYSNVKINPTNMNRLADLLNANEKIKEEQ
jgi:hypothetical protein